MARISLFDYKFSFYQRSKLYVPAWLAPEGIAYFVFVFVLCSSCLIDPHTRCIYDLLLTPPTVLYMYEYFSYT